MKPSTSAEPRRHSCLRFHVSAWSAWAPGLHDESAWKKWDGILLPPDDGSAPDVQFVNPMLRRRLGRLSRMALHVANKAGGEHRSVATVFASQHGELNRTVDLLHTLGNAELPSPASFSLSVHNAAAGIFSIARSDCSPATAIAAGNETLLWAIQDGASRLAADPSTPILVVYAEEPLPKEYQAFAGPAESTFALALLLCPGATTQLTWAENPDSKRSENSLARAFLGWWAGKRGDGLTWHGDRLTVNGNCHG